MENTNRVEAIIFDWAGTTMDWGCFAPAVVFVDVFKAKGIEDITIEEARMPMGAHKKIHIQKMTEMPSVRRKWRRVYGRDPTEADVEEMFEDFKPKQLACLSKYSELIPGTLEVQDWLRENGILIGSTTGYTGEMMETLLADAMMQGYFPDASVCSTGQSYLRHNIGHDSLAVYLPGMHCHEGETISRPKPDMCLINAKLLNVKPENCVKVGDTLDDIREGRAAGMKTIGLAMSGNELGMTREEICADADKFADKLNRAFDRLYLAGADYVVNGIWDVPEIIMKIENPGYRPPGCDGCNGCCGI